MKKKFKKLLDKKFKATNMLGLSTLPAPMKEKPELNTAYWSFAITCDGYELIDHKWIDDSVDNKYFEFGIFHSEEEAEVMAKAIMKFMDDLKQ